MEKPSVKPVFWAAALAIARKDVQTELRSRELVSTMGLFALLSVLIFSFALELDRAARIEAISGVLWVTLVFASILGLNRSMSIEREQGGFDALMLAPIARPAIFFGKLIGNFAFTLIVGALLLPVMTVLYNVTLVQGWLALALLLGAFGFATVGTLLATMTAQTRAREALMPLVMMPVALPLLLAAVRATNGILDGAPLDAWAAWLQILFVLDMVFVVLAYLLFEYVIEE